MAKREAALCVVDLRRGDSEIEQHAVHRREREWGEDVGQFREPGAAENETGVLRNEHLRGGFGGGIAIDSDQPAIPAEQRENGAGMTAAAEGGIGIAAGRFDRQRRHGFCEQDGDVFAMHACG